MLNYKATCRSTDKKPCDNILETDDPEFIALQRYGESIFDATGKLKNYAEIWESVHRAFKRAKEEGKEVEFLQLTGGESGVTDALLALQNWERAVANANKVIKAQIDYSELEKANDVANLASDQWDELGKALGETFQPAITAAAEQFFDICKSGTQWLIDHKKDLQEVFKTPIPINLFRYQNSEMDAGREILNNVKSNLTQTQKAVFAASEGLDDAYKNLHQKVKDGEKKTSDILMQYSVQRAKDLRQATEDLKVELDFDSDYMQAVRTAEIERQRALNQIVVGNAERKAIQEKYLADIEKAEKDHDDKLEEMTKETAALQYEATHSAYEKEIYDIEQWKKKAIEDLGEYKDAIGDKNRYLQESAAIVANAVAKETAALEKEIDRIQGKTLSLEEKIFKLDNDDKAAQVYDIQKDVTEMLESGDYNISRIAEYYKKALDKIGIDPLKQEDLFYNVRLRAEQFTPDIKLPEFDAPELPELPNPKLTVDTDSAVTDFKTALQASIEPIKISTSYFENSLTSAVNAVTAFSNSLVNAADQVSKLDFRLQSPEKIFSTHGSQTIQENFSLPKTETPKITLPKSDININKEFDKITSQIADLTHTAGQIANDLNKSKSPRPVINLSPTINTTVELKGSYIFTQAMANKMQDDIATEVYNTVTDAVTRAISDIRI